MKSLIFLALLPSVFSVTALANQRAQDNARWIILVDMQISGDFQSCVTQIEAIAQEQGTGIDQTLPRFATVVANLTNFSAQRVNELDCVKQIRKEGTMDGLPRAGRSN